MRKQSAPLVSEPFKKPLHSACIHQTTIRINKLNNKLIRETILLKLLTNLITIPYTVDTNSSSNLLYTCSAPMTVRFAGAIRCIAITTGPSWKTVTFMVPTVANSVTGAISYARTPRHVTEISTPVLYACARIVATSAFTRTLRVTVFTQVTWVTLTSFTNTLPVTRAFQLTIFAIIAWITYAFSSKATYTIAITVCLWIASMFAFKSNVP